MASRVVIVARYAFWLFFGSLFLVLSFVALRKASCMMSSASLTLPVIR
jgi:hypothetical protein